MPWQRRYAPGVVLETDRIRNFSIVSHVDHGKSTLSDRILELTETVDPRLMREQYLDSMDIERERGITIKAQKRPGPLEEPRPAPHRHPGHVDFGYEVSRSLAACEGAVLLVDASQGIQAQTLATCYQAIENNLEIVAASQDRPSGRRSRPLRRGNRTGPRYRRIDHPAYFGQDRSRGGRPARRHRRKVPAPTGDPDAALRALIFDSAYDQYRGW